MRRNKLEVFVHFVWATWDRLPLLMEEIERDVHRYISVVCADDGCQVLAIGGMPDHVHLLVKLSNTISLATLMKDVKGGSSPFVTEKLKAGDWFQWQGHYGAFSVRPKDVRPVIDYIQNQKARHGSGDLWRHAEEMSEEIVIGAD